MTQDCGERRLQSPCSTPIGDYLFPLERENGNGAPVEIDSHAPSERLAENHTDLTSLGSAEWGRQPPRFGTFDLIGQGVACTGHGTDVSQEGGSRGI
jgi:hypothetical protein